MISYREWDVLFPEGHLSIGVGADGFEQVVAELRGAEAVGQWRRFAEVLKPIAAAADALPLLALPPGGLDGLGPLLRRSGKLLPHLPALRHLSGAFGPLVDRHLQDPFLRNWVDLLCFLISGMPMADTNAAAMATLFGEWFDPEASLDYPREAVPRWWPHWSEGLKKHGGSLRLGARVQRILVDGERAVGVELVNGERIDADHVVAMPMPGARQHSSRNPVHRRGRSSAGRHRPVDRFCTFTSDSTRQVSMTCPFTPFGSVTGSVASPPSATRWWSRFHRCLIRRWHPQVITCCMPTHRPMSRGITGEAWSTTQRTTGGCGSNAVRVLAVLEQRIPDLRSRCKV